MIKGAKMIKQIGSIESYYSVVTEGDGKIHFKKFEEVSSQDYTGGLFVRKADDKYFWGLDNHCGIDWDDFNVVEEITENLFNALVKFENES